MIEFSEHEKALMQIMSEQNKAYMSQLNDGERKSMEKYVTVENLAEVEDMIGTDQQMEDLLFWDKGQKFNDKDRQQLTPAGPKDSELMEYAKQKYLELKKLAVEVQRKSDLTLFSQFNEGLLFTGVAPAVKVDENSFTGVELRLIGSALDNYNSITIIPEEDGYKVHLGANVNGIAQGVIVNGSDAFTLIQLAVLVNKDMAKADLECSLQDMDGNDVAYEAKTIRRAAKKGEAIDLPSQMKLFCEQVVATKEEAFALASKISRISNERFGIEAEVFNIGRQYGNFSLARQEDFQEFMQSTKKSGKNGIVFFTATLVCRRCRREVEGFAELSHKYPNVQFALVNLNAPHSKFHDRVYGDIAGGDADKFVSVAQGVTPFTVIYTPNANGELEYREYFATGKTEPVPTLEYACSVLDKHFKK